jgi:3-methyladenine DNA glycosylase AlkD
MSAAIQEIKKILTANSNKQNIEFFAKMVPGQQKIYGVKTPVLNELAKQFKEGSFALAEELWKSGSLEEKIIAIKIIEKKGKTDPDKVLNLLRRFSKSIDNWAVCDGLGMQFVRGVIKVYPEKIFSLANEYSNSTNFWERRLSLVMVEWYTRLPEFHPQIKALVRHLENDKEYYVKKAVVWIKKNFAKGK